MPWTPFDPSNPGYQDSRVSAEVLNNLLAMWYGDMGPLRARAQASPNLTVQVLGAEIQSFMRPVWVNKFTPSTYAGGNSPSIDTSMGANRIALLMLNNSGTLEWKYGAQGVSPSPPDCDEGKMPICYVYQRPSMTQITNTDGGSQGYIYRDVRQIFGSTGRIVEYNWSVQCAALFVGTNLAGFQLVNASQTIVLAKARVVTPSAVQNIIIDINKNATSIWNVTPANRLQIAPAGYVASQTSFDTTALANDDYLSMDIDQVGSGTAGAKLTVQLRCRIP